jgi:hypothetical protein
LSFETDFDSWDQQQIFTTLSLKSTYDEHNDDDDSGDENKDPFTTDPFDSSGAMTNTSGFDAIIGNNNISSNQLYGYHNGSYDQSNDYIMNYYASQCTNYPFTATNNTTSSTTTANIPPSSSYNPFHNYIDTNHLNDVNSNNDNWANFNSSPDNFADFDSHFASMPAFTETSSATSAAAAPIPTQQFSATTNELFFSNQNENDDQSTEISNDSNDAITPTNEEPKCFVATTQVIEISSAPPPIPQTPLPTGQEVSAARRDFLLGSLAHNEAITLKSITAFDEIDDEEFFSLRDDSNSLTDDNDRKLITEVPDDDDDDFASADERYLQIT